MNLPFFDELVRFSKITKKSTITKMQWALLGMVDPVFTVSRIGARSASIHRAGNQEMEVLSEMPIRKSNNWHHRRF